MKKYYMAMMILMAGVFSANNAAMATKPFTPVSEVILHSSCAPWDGQAYAFYIDLPKDQDLPDARLSVSIWGQGIGDLKNYSAFELTSVWSGSNSKGQANLVDLTKNNSDMSKFIDVTVYFEPMDLEKNLVEAVGFGRWHIRVSIPSLPQKEYHYTLSPAVSEEQQFCG